MPRVPWEDLPASVRGWAEGSLGSPVAGAASQPGGFSPGAACRLRLADGRRAFLKAVSASANPHSPGMHRREGAVAAALPPDVPAPALLGQYDDGEWVALLFADVNGVPPAEPWQPGPGCGAGPAGANGNAARPGRSTAGVCIGPAGGGARPSLLVLQWAT
jgi:hypothetical protein